MTSPALPLTREEVGSLASIIVVMQRRFMANLMGKLAKGSLSFPQYVLLGHLGSHGPTGMSSIAKLMGHSTPAATGLVQRLEKLRYIRRSHEKTDRRKVMVSITPQGNKIVEDVQLEVQGKLEAFKERLNPQEQRAWLDIYRKIHDYCTDCNS